MQQVTKYQAPCGYLYQVIAGRDMSANLIEARAERVCEMLGRQYLTAFRIARDCADASRVTVPA